MESLLAERLDQAASIDPVLTPLWQELVAAQVGGTGDSAMQAVAALSRFFHALSRMQHPLDELPAEIEEKLDGLFLPRTGEELGAIAAKYNATHIVTRQDWHPEIPGSTVVDQQEGWVLWAVNRDSN